MTTLRGILMLSATITGNLIVAYAVRRGLLALGASETLAGVAATTIWSVVAFSMLTSIAVRIGRRRTSVGASDSAARRYPTLVESESLAR
jgi:hypothetical protein